MQNLLYILQIPHFNGEHNNMTIYKTLEKSWILKNLRKESIFLYLKRHTFSDLFTLLSVAIFRVTSDLFTLLSVAIFRVTLLDRAQIFAEKATIYKNDMTQFVSIFSTWIKCEVALIFTVRLLMIKKSSS